MISIIIPCYNGAEWIHEAIESAIFEQLSITSPSEIIVVNDGSTDESLKIIERYPVKIINQANKGLASARNTGIMNAQYEFCLFLDADDKLLLGCLPHIKRKIVQGNVDIIAPSFREFGLSNREVILDNPTLEDFKTANRIGYCAAIRKSALQAIGGYSPRMTWGAEDYHLWFNLLTRGYKLVTIPEVLWMHRTKENSMWTETAKHREEFMTQIRKDFPW